MRIILTTLHSKYIHASLALPYLAEYCAASGRTLVIREFSVHQPKDSLLADLLVDEPDVLCFSVYLWNRCLTLELVASLKQVAPRMRIVLGGPEVSYENQDFFQHHPVDALISGEGEIPLRQLLDAWSQGQPPEPCAGLQLPDTAGPPGTSRVACLDALPSPFAAGRVALDRGLVYYESSRGCPFSCSFCMSALDAQVRSFSMERIRADLQLLLENRVAVVKFIDRTFNYDARRAQQIWDFLLSGNRCSRFHFEIGAQLLNDENLCFLEQLPAGLFQFEIGVQSTRAETLDAVERRVDTDALLEILQRLKRHTRIRLHLDLIAGLPGETYREFLNSVERVGALDADHLQIEAVKLLPGSPLRHQAVARKIAFDPYPPYSILKSPDISFTELEQVRGISRLNDLLLNSRRFTFLWAQLQKVTAGLVVHLEALDRFWRGQDLYRRSLSLKDLFQVMDDYLQMRYQAETLASCREALARDYAHHQRVVAGSAPDFFDTALTAAEADAVRQRIKQEAEQRPRKGKVPFFAAVFHHLEETSGRQVLLFVYAPRGVSGQQVRELHLEQGPEFPPALE